MARIGNVTEIQAVKKQLDKLKEKGIISDWELPYEHILTRLSAAIFFLTPKDKDNTEDIWKVFDSNNMFQYRPNKERVLSQLAWRVQFNKGLEA